MPSRPARTIRFNSGGGRTLGKRLLRLRVVTAEGLRALYLVLDEPFMGIAGRAVYEVSRLLRDSGEHPCLFTDQANPTSNAIYQRLGYRPLVDMLNVRVDPAP